MNDQTPEANYVPAPRGSGAGTLVVVVAVVLLLLVMCGAGLLFVGRFAFTRVNARSPAPMIAPQPTPMIQPLPGQQADPTVPSEPGIAADDDKSLTP